MGPRAYFLMCRTLFGFWWAVVLVWLEAVIVGCTSGAQSSLAIVHVGL